jgi:hypothetical protein
MINLLQIKEGQLLIANVHVKKSITNQLNNFYSTKDEDRPYDFCL